MVEGPINLPDLIIEQLGGLVPVCLLGESPTETL